MSADPIGRAVQGVSLWPFACWDCWFEFRRGHGCLSVVSVVRYRSLRWADHSSREVLPSVVCLSVIVKPRWWGGLGPLRAVAPWDSQRWVWRYRRAFWVVVLCRLIGGHRRFGRTWWLHFRAPKQSSLMIQVESSFESFMYVCVYTHTHTHTDVIVCVYIYVYIYI